MVEMDDIFFAYFQCRSSKHDMWGVCVCVILILGL